MYHRIFDEKQNPNLLSGIISALNTFVAQFDENGLIDFEMIEKRFIIAKREEILFITNCNRKYKCQDAKAELQKITQIFFNRYPVENIKNWDDDPSYFSDFTKKIETSLQ
jgi:hypothetical protein